MRIEHSTEEGVTFLVISGEIDTSNAGQLRAAGEEALTDFTGTLRIDLSGVDFMDSSGISALLVIREQANEDRHILILEKPSDQVRRVLELTGLTEYFQIK
jgi:anti-sigma B factor antagonist